MIEFLYTGNYDRLGREAKIFQGGQLGFAMTIRIAPDFDASVRLGFTSRLMTSPAFAADQQTQQIDAWSAQIRPEFQLVLDGETVIIERGATEVWDWAISYPLPDYSLGGDNRNNPLPGTVAGGWGPRQNLFGDPVANGVYAYEGIWETNFFAYLIWASQAEQRVYEYGWSDPITHLVNYYGT